MRAAFESRLRSLTAAAVAAVGLSAICAQPAGAQSLAEGLAKAYATNPTLRAARAELRAVNEGVPQANCPGQVVVERQLAGARL